LRLAVDTNVLLDLADKVEEVLDAFDTLVERLPHSDCLVPPSVLDELAYLCDFGQTERVRRSAQEAMKQLRRERRFRSLLEPPFDPAQAERLASEFRHRGLLPQFEVHDSRILAEATLLACAILVTSDAHLRAIDHERLTLLLHPHELAPPVIATPREIVRKFFR